MLVEPKHFELYGHPNNTSYLNTILNAKWFVLYPFLHSTFVSTKENITPQDRYSSEERDGRTSYSKIFKCEILCWVQIKLGGVYENDE